jgi:hypothetical protein
MIGGEVVDDRVPADQGARAGHARHAPGPPGQPTGQHRAAADDPRQRPQHRHRHPNRAVEQQHAGEQQRDRAAAGEHPDAGGEQLGDEQGGGQRQQQQAGEADRQDRQRHEPEHQ